MRWFLSNRGFLSNRAVTSALFLCLVAAAPVGGQDWRGRGRLDGSVTDESGNPLEGARVTLNRVGGSEGGPESLTTNARGRWSYLGLGASTWRVRTECVGYESDEGTMWVTEFGRNPTVQVRLVAIQAVATPAPVEVDTAVESADQVAKEQLSAAGRLIEQGQLGEARVLLEQAMGNLEPSKHPEVLLAIAKTYFQEKDVEQTILTLERALALDPDHLATLKLISSILVDQGRRTEAEPYRARLPAGQKIDPNVLLNLGIRKYNSGDLDGALAEFDKIVAEYASLPDAYYNRGLVHLAKGNNEQAAADFSKLLELDREHPNAAEAEQFLAYLRSP